MRAASLLGKYDADGQIQDRSTEKEGTRTVLDSYSAEITENKGSSLVRGRESAKRGRWEAPIRRRGLKVQHGPHRSVKSEQAA
jgi:hypothetical protein